MQLDEVDYLHRPQVNNDDKRQLLIALAHQIIEAINSIESKDEVSVNNLDEVTAALRNELSRANKVLIAGLKGIKIDSSGINNVEVNNLKDLKKYFDSINRTLKKYSGIVIPAPQVIVNPTPVNIPETKISENPPVDFTPVINELERNLKILRTNNKSHPLAVRLTDGGDWIKELKTLNKQAQQTTQFLSDVSYIKDNSGNRINPATAEGQNPGFQIPKYDYISLSPANLPTTVIYKLGGVSGITVATLSLTYSGSNIASVTRT